MDTERKGGHSPGSSTRVSRRGFLTELARIAGSVGVFAAGLWGHSKATAALPADALRPPGALPEEQFLGSCIRCGLCVRYCPFDTLKLAEFGSGVPAGTPWFTARQVPCEMCDDIPCVPVCPTGALDHGLTDINKARMGLAVLSDQETCLNFLGLRCDVCYRVCPVLDKAITLEMLPNPRTGKHALFIPVVHSEHCTGCGKCEKACPLPETAIRILPIALVKGRLAEHYRLGWVEKEKAGHSLIPEQIRLPVRGMEETMPGSGPLPGGMPTFPGGELPGQVPTGEKLWPSGRLP